MRGLAALALLLLTFAFAPARPASAAALVQVGDFGNNPTNLRMYVYAPDVLPARPALLVLVHYCGGSAGAVFGGNGRDFVTAADRHGYVIVLPEATRSEKCFDVSTAAALRRDGGGDSTGIASMVGWAKQRYNVDPARVVVSGFSSGAMMTNVLAAQYPDIFAAGAAFSGVPAGCFATSNGSLWNSQCAGGNLIKSSQQWADQARGMYPGYTGRYPRMQFWHGTTDTTLAYPNFAEEIKQWTGLHGLTQSPSFTDYPQQSWTRTRYGDPAMVEGVSVAGTGHTLPQTGMLAYAIAFLGLDGTTVPPPTWMKITNAATGLALDSGGNVGPGSNLKQWSYNGSANLQWQLVDLGGGWLRMVNRTNAMVADSWGNNTNGAPARQGPWNGGNNQQWRLNSIGNGRYQIINRGTGKALDGMGNSTAGSTVGMWTPNSHTNNQWTISPA